MKKLIVATLTGVALATGSAVAADMPVKAPVPAAPPAPVYSWTGCYIGANGGGGWGSDGAWTDTTGVSQGGQNFSGGLVGGQLGCDYQVSGSWVIGVAGMVDWATLSGSAKNPFSPALTANSKVINFDTFTGRIGMSFGQALIYVDGGAAWSVTHRYFTPPGTAGGPCGGAICQAVSDTATGWVVGGGLEYLFLPELSGKIEYDYARFDAVSSSPAIGATANAPYSIKQNISALLVGLNYRFPVVAK